MSGQKHTPGPWTIGMASGHNIANIYGPGDHAIVSTYLPLHHIRDDIKSLPTSRYGTDLANAHLIAAAPDLLDIAIRASHADGTLLGQAATWIGGVVDFYKMTGGNKESGERLYELLHALDAAASAAVAKATS